MPPIKPQSRLPTHEVFNMPPYLGAQDLWADDLALQHWSSRFGLGDGAAHMARAGAAAGSVESFEHGDLANRFPPELKAFDRYGMRLNAVTFHPSYHWLMGQAVEHGAHNYAWQNEGQGGHVGQAVLSYMFSQPEAGVMCPMSMTYSAVPTLRYDAGVLADWMPRVASNAYDQRDIPAPEKTGALIGMFMTEKQGGSDVRANRTTARPMGKATGSGAEYLLNGHKFFCSAPMCDAFLVLALSSEDEISCFLVPRWKPDSTRNALLLQRLKDKMGNRANASSEMEFVDTYGVMIGDAGRGIRTIVDMVVGNRIFCAAASAGHMRQALRQALHFAEHRLAFHKRLIDQPLMQNVLGDMALEVEAATALAMRVAGAMDRPDDAGEAALARVGTAVAKYWNCKRSPALIGEALECHGGSGYVEESIMPRLYREAPLNSIWEGSGNIMGLDVLRAMSREAGAMESLMAEFAAASGRDSRLDRAIDDLKAMLANRDDLEFRMRQITEQIALVWQGVLLTSGNDAVGEAFCANRLGQGVRATFGTTGDPKQARAMVERAMAVQ